MLGSHIESIITIFEDTMDKITQHPSYDEQHGMLVGFKKILEEEVNLHQCEPEYGQTSQASRPFATFRNSR